MKKVSLLALLFSTAFVTVKPEKAPETERAIFCQQLYNQKTELEKILNIKSSIPSEKSLRINYNLLKLKLNGKKQQLLLQIEQLNESPELLIKVAIADAEKSSAAIVSQIDVAGEDTSDREEKTEKVKDYIDTISNEPITKESIRKLLEEKIKEVDQKLAKLPAEAQFIATERTNTIKTQNGLNKLLRNQYEVIAELYEYCINQKTAQSSYTMQHSNIKTEIPDYTGKL